MNTNRITIYGMCGRHPSGGWTQVALSRDEARKLLARYSPPRTHQAGGSGSREWLLPIRSCRHLSGPRHTPRFNVIYLHAVRVSE